MVALVVAVYTTDFRCPSEHAIDVLGLAVQVRVDFSLPRTTLGTSTVDAVELGWTRASLTRPSVGQGTATHTVAICATSI